MFGFQLPSPSATASSSIVPKADPSPIPLHLNDYDSDSSVEFVPCDQSFVQMPPRAPDASASRPTHPTGSQTPVTSAAPASGSLKSVASGTVLYIPPASKRAKSSTPSIDLTAVDDPRPTDAPSLASAPGIPRHATLDTVPPVPRKVLSSAEPSRAAASSSAPSPSFVAPW